MADETATKVANRKPRTDGKVGHCIYFPVDVYERLIKDATQARRSISAHALLLIEQSLPKRPRKT